MATAGRVKRTPKFTIDFTNVLASEMKAKTKVKSSANLIGVPDFREILPRNRKSLVFIQYLSNAKSPVFTLNYGSLFRLSDSLSLNCDA